MLDYPRFGEDGPAVLGRLTPSQWAAAAWLPTVGIHVALPIITQFIVLYEYLLHAPSEVDIWRRLSSRRSRLKTRAIQPWATLWLRYGSVSFGILAIVRQWGNDFAWSRCSHVVVPLFFASSAMLSVLTASISAWRCLTIARAAMGGGATRWYGLTQAIVCLCLVARFAANVIAFTLQSYIAPPTSMTNTRTTCFAFEEAAFEQLRLVSNEDDLPKRIFAFVGLLATVFISDATFAIVSFTGIASLDAQIQPQSGLLRILRMNSITHYSILALSNVGTLIFYCLTLDPFTVHLTAAIGAIIGIRVLISEQESVLAASHHYDNTAPWISGAQPPPRNLHGGLSGALSFQAGATPMAAVASRSIFAPAATTIGMAHNHHHHHPHHPPSHSHHQTTTVANAASVPGGDGHRLTRLASRPEGSSEDEVDHQDDVIVMHDDDEDEDEAPRYCCDDDDEKMGQGDDEEKQKQEGTEDPSKQNLEGAAANQVEAGNQKKKKKMRWGRIGRRGEESQVFPGPSPAPIAAAQSKQRQVQPTQPLPPPQKQRQGGAAAAAAAAGPLCKLCRQPLIWQEGRMSLGLLARPPRHPHVKRRGAGLTDIDAVTVLEHGRSIDRPWPMWPSDCIAAEEEEGEDEEGRDVGTTSVGGGVALNALGRDRLRTGEEENHLRATVGNWARGVVPGGAELDKKDTDSVRRDGVKEEEQTTRVSSDERGVSQRQEEESG